MRRNSVRLTGATWLVVGFAALAAHAEPVETHKTNKSHSETAMIWCSSSVWTGKGPSTAIADSPQLTTGWTLTPADIAAGLAMYDYTSMNDAMAMLSHITQDQLSSYSIEITRSQAGLPLDLQVTINSETFVGPAGFRQELAAPLTMSLQRTGFAPTGTPGLFQAIYTGMAAPVQFLITDPAVGTTPFVTLGAGPEAYELRILTAVPEPATAALGVAGLVALASWRRRK